MSAPSKYDNKTARFEFTKSQTAGRYNMRNPLCRGLTLHNATPEEIGKFFADTLIVTLASMDKNEATKIILQCKWE